MALKTQPTQVADDKRTGAYYEGKEILLTKSSGNPTKQARHHRDWWPEDKRIEAATLWAVVRDVKQVAKLTGIPVSQINKMREKPWWIQIVQKVRKEKNEVLDDKITEALDGAVDIVLDRFKHGEVIYDRKSKEHVRIPVKVKDIAYMTSTLFDKRQLLRGEATNRSENITYDQKLANLKETFEKLATSVNINPKSEPIDVIEYEEETNAELPDQEIKNSTIKETSPEQSEDSKTVQDSSQSGENGSEALS